MPQDWATHLIGHELTALHGIDHARTLAIGAAPLLEGAARAQARQLLQYASRVGASKRVTKRSASMRLRSHPRPFERLGIDTRLSAYQGDRADRGAASEAHGMTAPGERQNITCREPPHFEGGALSDHASDLNSSVTRHQP